MKTPVPPTNDPAREEFLNTLTKNDINIDEYLSIYEKSSIPPNNRLSTLSLAIFQDNASLVSEFKKYEDQLGSVIQKHIQDGNIKQLENTTFVITNPDAFHHRFAGIQNVNFTDKQEKVNRRSQPLKLLQPTTNTTTSKSVIEFRRSIVISKATASNSTDKENHAQSHHVDEMPDKRKGMEPRGICLEIPLLFNNHSNINYRIIDK